jgi:predicted PurR-regulated permease PerM
VVSDVRVTGREASAERKRVEVTVPTGTILKGLLIALVIYVGIIAAEVLLTIALSLVFALGLDPIVNKLTARGWGRGKSALVVFTTIFLAVSILVIWAAKPIWNEVQGLTGNLPEYVEELKDDPVFDQLESSTGVMDKAEGAAEDIAKAIPEAASSLLGITGDLVGSIFSVVTIVFLTLFLLIGLPDLKKAALALTRPDTCERIERVYGEVESAIFSSLVGNIVISVIAGTVVGVTALLVGAPFPIVLAFIVGMFDLIPQVGSAIAAVIVVSITLAATGAGAAAIMLVVILIYQQVENYVIQPVVYGEAVDLSGFATIACVMAGGAILGVLGAILAVPVAASVKIIVKELTSDRREQMAAMRAQPAD